MQNVDFREIIERYKYKVPIALALVGIVLILGGLFISSYNKPSKAEFPKESLVQSQKITVDVSGAVANPGVYQLQKDSRVEDAIKAAGGLREKVNSEYVSKSLNLAQKVSDGMKIYLPFEGETGGVSGGSVAGIVQSGKVNLNTGTQAELEDLPGIGPVTAGKIISGRPYAKVEDLLDQKIVSKATFEKIKDSLSL